MFVQFLYTNIFLYLFFIWIYLDIYLFQKFDECHTLILNWDTSQSLLRSEAVADFLRLQARKVKARLIRKSMASRMPMVKFVAKRTFQNSIFNVGRKGGFNVNYQGQGLFEEFWKNPWDCICDAHREEEGVVTGW